MKTHRMSVLAGLLLFAACSLFAATYSHVQGIPGHYNGTANVPTAANCNQFGAAYPGPLPSYITNDGPLGYYACTVGQSFNVSGAIPAGNWNIDQRVSGNGYSGTVITW